MHPADSSEHPIQLVQGGSEVARGQGLCESSARLFLRHGSDLMKQEDILEEGFTVVAQGVLLLCIR